MQHIYQVHPIDCQPLRPANDDQPLRSDASTSVVLMILSAVYVLAVLAGLWV